MESQKYSTLLVDDELEQVRLFKEFFADQRFQHLQEKDKILPFILQNPPDIIFLNTHLFNDSTLDCLHLIKNNPQTSSIPVIIYSTPISTDEIAQCLSLGALRYLVKPLNARGLYFGLQIIMYLLQAGTLVCTDPKEFLINTNHGYFIY